MKTKHILYMIYTYTLRNCRQNSNTANKAEIQMAKQLLEFQRVLICMSVCKVSRATLFHQAGASHPPTFHPPASTLLLINLGAHPLRRGYRQNFVFLLCSIFYCLLFSSLQFPVLDLDYPNWMCIQIWIWVWAWNRDMDQDLDPRPSPLAPAVGQSDCLHSPGDALAGALRSSSLCPLSSHFPWTRSNPRHQFNMNMAA